MEIAGFIDHTNLKADCNVETVRRLCKEAKANAFAAVCLPPYFIKDAALLLQEKDKVKIATVAGFPMGYAATPAKVEEIKRAIDDGADEIDAVINFSALKSQHWNYVRSDIDSMITATHLKGKHIKIIVEFGLLSEEELHNVLDIIETTQPDYVKTSTGFHGFPTTVDQVAILRKSLSPKIRIKAAGGIRTIADAQRLIDAGAARIGTSAALEMLGV